MLKKLVTAGVIVAATANAAYAAQATLIDGSSLGWATHCQKELTVAETHSGDFVATGCPITLQTPVKEWSYAYVNEIVTVADRLASRDLPSWVMDAQAGTLDALGEHLKAHGFDSVDVERMPASAGVGAEAAAEQIASAVIAGNKELPKLQREELGLIIVATEPRLEVEYKGEVENPNPHYTGSNPFKQLGGAMSAYGNGPFVFDGEAEITMTQPLFIFGPSGELLDTREVQSKTTAKGIHLSMDDPKIGSMDISATYNQMREIKRQGYASEQSEDIEDNRYEKLKDGFTFMGATLAAKVPGEFQDTQRIKEAAGL